VTGSGNIVSYNTQTCSTGDVNYSFSGVEGTSDQITINPKAAMGSVTVSHYVNRFHPDNSLGTKSWWLITPTIVKDCNTITFKFRESDMNSLVLNQLKIFEWTGSEWLKHTEATYASSSSSSGFASITFNNLTLDPLRSSFQLTLGDQANSTLPVTLSSFDAVVISSSMVNIKWVTQSETNVFGYHIFRHSENNLTDALRISDYVISATNSSTEQVYLFKDEHVQPLSRYYYWLQSADLDGSIQYHGPVTVMTGDNNIVPPEIPLITGLKTAYPNPFNPSTTISFELAEPHSVCMEIFNIKGQKVVTLINENYLAGRHSIVWNGRDHYGIACQTGVYFCRMQANNYQEIYKLMILK